MQNEIGHHEVTAPRTPVPTVVGRRIRALASFGIAMLGLSLTSGLGAQNVPAPAAGPLIKLGGSPNVQVLSHLPLEGFFYNGGIDIEQEMSRPYAYVPLWLDKAGFVVIDLSDPTTPEIIYRWEIENAELHQFGRGETGKYFKTGDRYYYVKTTIFGTAGPDPDLCAVVFDVTGLPDPDSVREVGRIRSPDIVTGCLSVFPYKHSDGRTLLLAGVRGATPGTEPHGKIYDMDRFVAGDADQGYVGPVPLPDLGLGPTNSAYHDLYAAYDIERGRDVVYGGGAGGFHMYDMTIPENLEYLGSISGTSGVQRGHTIITTPDNRYAVTQMEYQYAPMMIFDISPIQDGITQRISRPQGAWIADWKNLAHNMEVRWPYVFVAAYEDGLQVFDMRDPTDPVTLGWHYTCQCTHQTGFGGGDRIRGTSVFNGAMEVDVRNEDGLIVVSDLNTGFWAFRLNGFNGWNGRDYGLPNVSSAQNWDFGPIGDR